MVSMHSPDVSRRDAEDLLKHILMKDIRANGMYIPEGNNVDNDMYNIVLMERTLDPVENTFLPKKVAEYILNQKYNCAYDMTSEDYLAFKNESIPPDTLCIRCVNVSLLI